MKDGGERTKLWRKRLGMVEKEQRYLLGERSPDWGEERRSGKGGSNLGISSQDGTRRRRGVGFELQCPRKQHDLTEADDSQDLVDNLLQLLLKVTGNTAAVAAVAVENAKVGRAERSPNGGGEGTVAPEQGKKPIGPVLEVEWDVSLAVVSLGGRKVVLVSKTSG